MTQRSLYQSDMLKGWTFIKIVQVQHVIVQRKCKCNEKLVLIIIIMQKGFIRQLYNYVSQILERHTIYRNTYQTKRKEKLSIIYFAEWVTDIVIDIQIQTFL